MRMNRNTSVVAGVLAGAMVMWLWTMVMVLYGFRFLGVVLMLLIMLLSGAVGWLIGVNQKLRDEKYRAYRKGYENGYRNGTEEAGITICPDPDTWTAFGFRKTE